MPPSQGFRHAATLLLTNGIRGLPHDGSPALVAEVLTRLARDLVALAEDTRAPADALTWTRDEYGKTLDRACQTFSHRADADFAHIFEMAKIRGGEILEGIGKGSPPNNEPRDLFLLYVPEDRLPVAAPLAIELTKRRFTVAFSNYEVASSAELAAGVERGLAHHRAGVLLLTPEFSRKQWPTPRATSRLRLLHPVDPVSTANELAVWLADLKGRNSAR